MHDDLGTPKNNASDIANSVKISTTNGIKVFIFLTKICCRHTLLTLPVNMHTVTNIHGIHNRLGTYFAVFLHHILIFGVPSGLGQFRVLFGYKNEISCFYQLTIKIGKIIRFTWLREFLKIPRSCMKKYKPTYTYWGPVIDLEAYPGLYRSNEFIVIQIFMGLVNKQ